MRSSVPWWYRLCSLTVYLQDQCGRIRAHGADPGGVSQCLSWPLTYFFFSRDRQRQWQAACHLHYRVDSSFQGTVPDCAVALLHDRQGSHPRQRILNGLSLNTHPALPFPHGAGDWAVEQPLDQAVAVESAGSPQRSVLAEKVRKLMWKHAKEHPDNHRIDPTHGPVRVLSHEQLYQTHVVELVELCQKYNMYPCCATCGANGTSQTVASGGVQTASARTQSLSGAQQMVSSPTGPISSRD